LEETNKTERRLKARCKPGAVPITYSKIKGGVRKMGDTLEYIDSECDGWAEEIDYQMMLGSSLDQAIEIVGLPPLPDCYEYITQM
jgi:hypothetical protein